MEENLQVKLIIFWNILIFGYSILSNLIKNRQIDNKLDAENLINQNTTYDSILSHKLSSLDDSPGKALQVQRVDIARNSLGDIIENKRFSKLSNRSPRLVKQLSKINNTFNLDSSTDCERKNATTDDLDRFRNLFDDNQNILPEPLSISKVECLEELPFSTNLKKNIKWISSQTNDNQLLVFAYARDKLLMLRQIEDYVKDEDKKYEKDPQMVSEYAMDIFYYMNYIEEKFQISKEFLTGKFVTAEMRAKLIDWLICVHHQHLKFKNDTLFLCIQLLDAFLQVKFCFSLFQRKFWILNVNYNEKGKWYNNKGIAISWFDLFTCSVKIWRKRVSKMY